MAQPARAPLFTGPFIALAFAELAYFTAAGIAVPLTGLYARDGLGGDELGVGIAIGAFGVTALLLRPIAGPATDRWGRRVFLISGAALCAVAFAIHPLAPNLPVLIGLRLLLGVAEAFFFVAGFAALADLAPPGRAGEALSFNSLALYIGLAIGPLLGETLLHAGGFTLAWMGAAVLGGTAALLSLTLPDTGSRSDAGAPSIVLLHRAALGPGLLLFAGITAMAGFLGYVVFHAQDVGLDGAGAALLVFGLAVVGCRVLFARLPDRVNPILLGTAALTVTAIGLVLVAWLASIPGLLFGTLVLGIGVAFITPALFAAIMTRVPPAERGVAMGSMSVFIDLAFATGPLLVGFVSGLATIPVGFVAAALVAAAGALAGALSLARRPASASAA